MENTPDDYATIFTFWWYMDLFYYGILIAGISLANFSVVIYGWYDGQLGVGCNNGFNDSCIPVFSARSACFASLLWNLMLHGLVCKHPTRSVFQMKLLDNKLLLACVVALSLTAFVGFPSIITPNTHIFNISFATVRTIRPGHQSGLLFFPRIRYRHTCTEIIVQDVFFVSNMTWEYAPVVSGVIVFFVFTELWKLFRRAVLKRSRGDRDQPSQKADPEKGQHITDEKRNDKSMRMADTIQPDAPADLSTKFKRMPSRTAV